MSYINEVFLQIIKFLKGDLPNNKNSSFTQHHVLPNLYEFLSS